MQHGKWCLRYSLVVLMINGRMKEDDVVKIQPSFFIICILLCKASGSGKHCAATATGRCDGVRCGSRVLSPKLGELVRWSDEWALSVQGSHSSSLSVLVFLSSPHSLPRSLVYTVYETVAAMGNDTRECECDHALYTGCFSV